MGELIGRENKPLALLRQDLGMFAHDVSKSGVAGCQGAVMGYCQGLFRNYK